jgi:hypothetical protein
MQRKPKHGLSLHLQLIPRRALGALAAAAALAAVAGAEPAVDRSGARDYVAALRAESPVLADFEERLFTLRTKERAILARFTKKQLSREQAREQLLPLIESEDEILNDKEYKVEQRLHFAAADEKRAKENVQAAADHERMQAELRARLKAAKIAP